MSKRRLLTKRMHPQIKGILRCGVIQSRRDTLVKMLTKRHGHVPCFVCGDHVEEADESLEHIVPLSGGGSDEMSNLSISHKKCNQLRGDATPKEPYENPR